MNQNRLRVAILGTGNIGTDLLYKVRRSAHLKCSYFIGRRTDSPGLARARDMGIHAMSGGIHDLMDSIQNIDLVFDATSATDHNQNSRLISAEGKHLINLTPAKLGNYFVPNVTKLTGIKPYVAHLNMVTCGGQTCIPIIYTLKNSFPALNEVEVVSTISSKSAGPATRKNLDEYIENTETAIIDLTGVTKVKALILLNPALPEIIMHTSIYFSIPETTSSEINKVVLKTVSLVKESCPGYELSSETIALNENTYHLALSVKGSGDYLPVYAGNLDIINIAAISAAEQIGKFISE